MPRPRPNGPRLVSHRGVWCVEWWDGGTRRRVSAGTANPAIARQFLADFEAAAERRPTHLTVAEALTRYGEGRRGKIIAYDRLEGAAKALRVAIGDLRVDQVTQARWDRYAADRVTRPRPKQKAFKPQPVSSSTLRREYNVLRAALRLAWKDGYLVKPPAIQPPAETAPRDRYLTKQEARRLIEAAKTPHVKVFVALAVFTGARRGSILALTWDRVDFERGMIDFQEPGRPLTKKRRSMVPITDQLLPLLQHASEQRIGDYVVEYEGKKVPHGLRWSFKRLCQAAGLTWQPTPHVFKHSVASWMAMDRVPIDQAADWLATDPATLRRTYRKFDPAYLRPVAASLKL